MQEEESNKDNLNFIKSNKQHGVIPFEISFTSLILFKYWKINCWKQPWNICTSMIILKESLGMRSQ